MKRIPAMSKKLDEVASDAIEQAIQDLAREGLLVDTGERRWSPRTGQYEIVWTVAVHDQQKKPN